MEDFEKDLEKEKTNLAAKKETAAGEVKKENVALEKLKKENDSLKKKLTGKDAHIKTLKKELKDKPLGASKSVEHV